MIDLLALDRSYSVQSHNFSSMKKQNFKELNFWTPHFDHIHRYQHRIKSFNQRKHIIIVKKEDKATGIASFHTVYSEEQIFELSNMQQQQHSHGYSIKQDCNNSSPFVRKNSSSSYQQHVHMAQHIKHWIEIKALLTESINIISRSQEPLIESASTAAPAAGRIWLSASTWISIMVIPTNLQHHQQQWKHQYQNE